MPKKTQTASITPTVSPVHDQYIRWQFEPTFLREGEVLVINVFRTLPFNVETFVDYHMLQSFDSEGFADSAIGASDPSNFGDMGFDFASGSGTLHFTNNGSESDFFTKLTVTGLPFPDESSDNPDAEPLEVFFKILSTPRSPSINAHLTGVNPYPVFIVEDGGPHS